MKVFGFLAGAETLGVLRKGGPAASLADASYNNCAWIAADQLLQFFGAKKPIDPNAQYNVDPIQVTLITATNVPKTGRRVSRTRTRRSSSCRAGRRSGTRVG